jgi:hypothetical protein
LEEPWAVGYPQDLAQAVVAVAVVMELTRLQQFIAATQEHGVTAAVAALATRLISGQVHRVAVEQTD